MGERGQLLVRLMWTGLDEIAAAALAHRTSTRTDPRVPGTVMVLVPHCTVKPQILIDAHGSQFSKQQAMEAKGVVASLALHTVLEPVFTEVSGSHSELSVMFVVLDFQMEREESLLASVQTLRDAFTKVFISSSTKNRIFIAFFL